ncbi:hypothetical protein H0E87_030168 [Populus deltoides]|uniref:Uncharacterized protein n=1 Tax=Populus deltoides TaxID=3696 RepID=A0A8T2WF97_POPDE|nr:hypothetical protein H0E87_030168 [Populus deltoides]
MKEAIVLYPAATSHQMISMVELAKLILQHHPNISITILVAIMPFDTSTISTYISSISQTSLPISFLSLPQPSEDPPGPAAAATLGKAAFDYIRLYTPKVLDALKTISLTSTVLAFIISTFGITYATPIPTYLYFTSGASSFASILYLPTIHNQTTKSLKDLPNNTPLHFPGLPPIKPSHLPEPLLDRGHPAYQEFFSLGTLLPNLKGMILNTFDMLEPQAIKAITEGACVPKGSTPPLYCIGPRIVDAKQRGASDDALSKCLLWLDKQPSQSVVFLCFGRKGAFSAPQLKEISFEDVKGGVVSSEEVERKVRELMGLEGKGFRESSSMMKKMAMAAWTNGGSSFTALSKLVASWKQEQS